MALGLTFIAGACLLLGILLSLIGKDKQKLSKFVTGLAFTILLGMIILDLIPEMLEHLESENFWYRTFRIVICLALGMGVFKILDKFIPHHHEHNNMDDTNHLFHIGIITSIAIIMHNIIEGIAIYSISLYDIKTGIFMCLGVALHNIPLGAQIGSSIRGQRGKIATKCTMIILLTLSTTFGAAFLKFSNMQIDDILLGTLITITLGMVIYLTVFELLKELIEHRNDKYTLIGAVVGIVIIAVSLIV